MRRVASAGHDDYQLSFGPDDPKGQKRLTLSLGFGGESQNFLLEYGDVSSEDVRSL